jgi:hypothetical protein
MQAGTIHLPHLVSNISGGPITGLTGVDFTVTGQVGDALISSGTIEPSISGAGYYLLVVDIPVGSGFISVKPTNSNYSIAPTFYDIDATAYSVDDVYTSIARQTLDVTQTAISSYESQSIGPYKEGDDIVLEYVVPNAVTPSISGYTDYKASLYRASVLTSVTGAGFVTDITILSVDETNKIVSMLIPSSGCSEIVTEGSIDEYFYSDLQAVTPQGYKKTLAELSILFRRNVTR